MKPIEVKMKNDTDKKALLTRIDKLRKEIGPLGMTTINSLKLADGNNHKTFYMTFSDYVLYNTPKPVIWKM
jgi:hypothetical protein